MSFKLQANPSFKAQVNIPIPGEKAEPVTFTFKHKTRAQFDALIAGLASGDEHIDNAVKEVVIEWVYPGVEFNAAALEQCLDMFPGSALAIFSAYRDNLLEARRKKLREAARQMAGGNQGDVGMFASMGIPPEQWEKMLAPDEIEIWPENWAAVEVFSALQTQWRVGMSGPTGLDYAVLPAVMDLLEVERRAECFAALQVMEIEALEVFRTKTSG